MAINLSRIVERHAQFSPRQVALHVEGEDITYARLWQLVDQATAALLEAGIKCGDRVAYLGLNDPALLALLFGVARIGAILLPLNYRLAAMEQTAILAHSGACLMVADDAHAQAASLLCEVGGPALMLTDGLRASAPQVDPIALKGGDDAPVLLVYTSGTTGKPKGALHTQSGLLWNCINATHAQELTPADHVLTVLPLFHVGGLCIQTLPALHAGASVTLQRRFDAGAWLSDVQRRRPTLSVMVPATLRAVLEHPHFERTDLSSLKLLVAGSSVVPSTMIAAFHARGLPVGQVYGATETGPVSIYLRRADAIGHPGAAGRAGLHVEVRLVDVLGEAVAPGEVGEIWIRAPNVMACYWNDPGNPEFQDGWFHSGDLARLDADGYYWVVGRSKDMIVSGGENIYPAEIENILAGCADIVDAAVLGQGDAIWGEVAVAVVVKRTGSALDEAAVMRLFEGQLARYKRPSRVLFRDHLPMTALGKVQKPELRGWLDSL